mgnify:CR=1 FL=1
MKNLINKVSVLLIALSLFACTEGNKVIDQVLNETEIGGGVLRTVSIPSPTIATGNAASKFSAIVEVQDLFMNKHKDITTSPIIVKHTADNTKGVDGSLSDGGIEEMLKNKELNDGKSRVIIVPPNSPVNSSLLSVLLLKILPEMY